MEIIESIGYRDYSVDIEEADKARGGYWVVAVRADRTGGIISENYIKWHRTIDAARKTVQSHYNEYLNQGD